MVISYKDVVYFHQLLGAVYLLKAGRNTFFGGFLPFLLILYVFSEFFVQKPEKRLKNTVVLATPHKRLTPKVWLTPLRITQFSSFFSTFLL